MYLQYTRIHTFVVKLFCKPKLNHMKLIFLKSKKIVKKGIQGVVSVFLMLFLVLGFDQEASAQSLTAGSGISPNSEVNHIAGKLGIKVYAFNSWKESTVKDVLRQKHNQTGEISLIDRYKRVYYELVMKEMSLDVAPQLATIQMLTVARKKINDTGITDAVARSVYNDLIGSF